MYYCRNCGEPYASDDSVMCMRCGYQRGKGNNYCPSCGNMVAEDAQVCVYCGTGFGTKGAGKTLKPNTGSKAGTGGKSRSVAGVLGIFFGSFGVHNFYLGYTAKAVIQLVGTIVSLLLTCIFIGVIPLFGIAVWSFVEAIMILTGYINTDAMGNPLVD